MCKLFGAIIILISAFFISYYPLHQRKQRINFLRDLIHDFQYIHNELRTNLSSLPELIDFLCENSGVSTRQIYPAIQSDLIENGVSCFNESWICAFENHKTHLTSEELNALLYISNVLGRYTLDEQLSAVKNVIQTLQTSYLHSKSDYREREKLYLGLGTSLGIMVVILLV